MKSIKFGNIVDVTSGIIVHGCNAQGVMGSGVAGELRGKYPQIFSDYRAAYERADKTSGFYMGEVILTEISENLIIANAITQFYFGKDGVKYVSYEAIQKAFRQIVTAVHEQSLAQETEGQQEIEIHYPMIGAGLGGGDWSVISQIIDQEFEPYPLIKRTLWILEPPTGFRRD